VGENNEEEVMDGGGEQGIRRALRGKGRSLGWGEEPKSQSKTKHRGVVIRGGSPKGAEEFWAEYADLEGVFQQKIKRKIRIARG